MSTSMPTSMSPAPRIAPAAQPLAPDLARAMARLVPAGMAPPRIFLTVARHAGLFTFLVDSGLLGPTGLLDRRTLPAALRETVILRTCVATRCDYEFNLHVQTISQRMGLQPAQIADVRSARPDPALWTPQQRAAMDLVDALVPGLDLDDAVFDACRAHLDEATMIEVTQLAGLYVGVAMQVALARPEMDRYRDGPPMRASA
jgi:alkylhydroperoxidase family enzyme